MTAEQLDEWQAYDRLDPIGTWRGDYQTALICSVVVNLALGMHGKKGAKKVTPYDFMPHWGEKKARQKGSANTSMPQQSVEEMKAILTSIARHCNRKKKP